MNFHNTVVLGGRGRNMTTVSRDPSRRAAYPTTVQPAQLLCRERRLSPPNLAF